jgi:hypothetical protein
MGDSRHVIAYCMTAEQTLANRRASPEPGNDTRLVSIDTTTGASADVAAGPGVKINPSPLAGPLAGNDIGYIRNDTAEAGVYYSSGRRGPVGTIRSASWSPDGTQVVYYKRNTTPRPAWRKAFSRNPNYAWRSVLTKKMTLNQREALYPRSSAAPLGPMTAGRSLHLQSIHRHSLDDPL